MESTMFQNTKLSLTAIPCMLVHKAAQDVLRNAPPSTLEKNVRRTYYSILNIKGEFFLLPDPSRCTFLNYEFHIVLVNVCLTVKMFLYILKRITPFAREIYIEPHN